MSEGFDTLYLSTNKISIGPTYSKSVHVIEFPNHTPVVLHHFLAPPQLFLELTHLWHQSKDKDLKDLKALSVQPPNGTNGPIGKISDG